MTTFIPSLTLPAAIFANQPVSILLPVLAGAGIGYSLRPKETQATYKTLKQPPFRPPPYVFGPTWTVLYALMGYAAHRAYRTGMSPHASLDQYNLTKQGATLYTIQLGLNILWMPLFFGLRRPIEAAIDIVALSGTVGYLTYVWGLVDPVVGWCLMPYCAWLGFATYLTIGVGYLNGWCLTNKN
ncbi:Translocator protein-like protein [Golovinomyces cichoracearum]|uniref:Translocator protein-like protein n=1 Tax=Golovinomyces cichoracearum TaxID=62708 RepID=A0A420JBG5_9PEZI|nr:Translocator protein-like protein [Golovinomyces cichoracearum]